ncbi:SOH1-domain-containing protein [Dioszegia hungarica]|uniref:Mediator of RNA polymerase II transcription subunit 31 n=1 Tax=Dioszegia hungarica TaxID=4972 RepID=A0AA38LV01_9TREE|nr:SOH1-domain-containing protein [Dioszegia hungarica]KAI9634651.1 SOH1-domain-containing protein [Dioszegia hungarica]
MQQHPHILPLPPLDGETVPLPRSAERTANLVKFQAELEFLQCLANPLYLRELSIQGYYDQPEFLNYLKYLEYWRKPEYVKYIVYPTCLVYLTLLQQASFRERLSDPVFVAELMRIGVRHHETW